MLKTLTLQVGHAFNGEAVLPRVFGWDELRRSLAVSPLEIEPDLGRLLRTPLGARYGRSLSSAGLVPAAAAATLSMGHGAEPMLVLELRFESALGRTARDRWELEVDGNGVVTGLRSESHVGDWAFSADGFSQFLGEILRAA